LHGRKSKQTQDVLSRIRSAGADGTSKRKKEKAFPSPDFVWAMQTSIEEIHMAHLKNNLKFRLGSQISSLLIDDYLGSA
jgi:hypothetical protein